MRNAEIILESEQKSDPTYTYDAALVRFGALMHDVGDNKYALPGACRTSIMGSSLLNLIRKRSGEDVTRMVHDMIMSAVGHAPEHDEFATKVQAIATGVSYTAELANPEKVKDLIKEIPELAIVQVCLHPTSHNLPLHKAESSDRCHRTPTASTQSARPESADRTCTAAHMICHYRRQGR